MKKPSLDTWLAEAKERPDAHLVGMYLSHNGVVRSTARVTARYGQAAGPVRGMIFGWNEAAVNAAVAAAEGLEGIYHVRVWLGEGQLNVGDDIMQVLIGGDTRPHTVAALEYLVSRLKNECVTETEVME